tara:strand:+ start:646 stop:1095 length:450 start_codon:yes stop_codon:yes gene_type:complete
MFSELLIATLALYLGLLLKKSRVIQDEIKDGKKYIQIFLKTLLIIIIIIALKEINILLIIGIIIGIILGFFIKQIQLYLGLILSTIFSLSLVSIIFIFNLIDSTNKDLRKISLRTILFLIPILFVTFINPHLLLGIGIGGSLLAIYKGL